MKVPRIWAFFGDLGSYKTSFLTFICRCLMADYDIGAVGNLNLKLDGFQKLDITELVGNEYLDKVIALTEIYSEADSRMSLSEKNIFFSYAIAQARKSPKTAGGRGIGNFVLYDSQLVSTPDIRLFELTNVYVMCEQLEDESCSFEYVTSEVS